LNTKLSESLDRSVDDSAEERMVRLTTAGCRIFCVGFALLEAFSQRYFINEDGISYLDMSDALLKHNWHLLINPIWSPLYPLLIGLMTWFTHPTIQWEMPVVHALNFLIFLGALASFEFLLRQVIKLLRENTEGRNIGAQGRLPVWVWQLFAYGIFSWASFGMIWSPRMVTPDMCVAMFLYLDGGLLLSFRSDRHLLRTGLLFGITLGLGYLAKAILFPMAAVFIVTAFLVTGARKKAIPPLVLTSAVFCAIAAPLVIAMSARVGKPSYSEVGNLNYAWHVNYVSGGKLAGGPFFPAGTGAPPYLRHPVTLLFSSPEVYAFKEDLSLTYPPRSDMAYWGAGTKVVFSPRNQLRAIVGGLVLFVRDPHILPMSLLIIASLLVILLGQRSPRRIKSILAGWPLLIPGVIGPAMYLLISVEPRYVAPFFLLILLGLFPGVALGNSEGSGAPAKVWPVAAAAGLMTFSALLVAYHFAGFPRGENGKVFLEAGVALNNAGIRPGDEIAIIGDSSDGCRWARMAGVRIVAQILREDTGRFWQISDPRLASEVYAAFSRAGAAAVVSEEPPPSGKEDGWQRLGDTDYYVHILRSGEKGGKTIG
jgi:hypothetical protein